MHRQRIPRQVLTADWGQLCLCLAVLLCGNSAVAAEPSVRPGVVEFFESHDLDAGLAGLDLPEVVAGEFIIWWSDLEPRDGQYDWERLDRALQQWEARGKRLDVRIATAHLAKYKTPAWLFDKYGVARVTATELPAGAPASVGYPDYFSPEFRDKWQRLIVAFAARYARHPALGVISVGGFGRWEEVILDDDVPGRMDAAWLARGYSPQKHYEQILWCMDLFRRTFPEHPLRICLAYGLQRQSNVDWMYRRVAQAAVERRIGLKQNGLTELYASWNEDTNASYLFQRYRYHPGISLTYETAGQISRNSFGAHGHPESCLQRALLDGADAIFLYPMDLRAPVVREELPTVAAQIGHPNSGPLYCLLADFHSWHEETRQSVEYQNRWRGLRQVQTDGARVEWATIAGEPCARTSPTNSRMAFDFDDRLAYHGVFAATLLIRYLDQGTDRFGLTVYDETRRDWVQRGEVKKENSGQWKWAHFVLSDLLASPRNHGADQQHDLVISDYGDGIEHIAALSISVFCPRDWQRQIVVGAEPGSAHQALTADAPRLTRTIDLPGQQPLCEVSIPLWTGSLEVNSVRGKVFAILDDHEQLISDKQYYLPADGDWLELPLYWLGASTRYRLELSEPAGAVGWYLASDGSLAFRAAAHVPDESCSTRVSPNRREPHERSWRVQVPQPLAGWKVVTDQQSARVNDWNWDVFAEGPEGIRFPVPFRAVPSSATAEALRILPLPAGAYEIRAQSESFDAATTCDLEPVVLAPR